MPIAPLHGDFKKNENCNHYRCQAPIYQGGNHYPWAAILLPKLEIFPHELVSRRQIARKYTEQLAAQNPSLTLPGVFPGIKSAWAQYSILAPDAHARKTIQDRLQENGIPTAVYYPTPLHSQTAFVHLGYEKGDFPVSEDCAERIFSIPMHPYLPDADLNKICSMLG